MYEERQKKWVFDQTVGVSHENRFPPKGQSTTATSHNNAGGMTSSSPVKPMSDAPPREPGTGRWILVKMTTYSGQGQPMDIGKLRAEGRCFRCHEKEHLSKDCPKKRDYKDIRSVMATEPTKQEEVTESKVEEVKA